MEMFVCTQYRLPVTLMARACVERQRRAKEAVDVTGRYVRRLPMSFEKCIDCEQGRKIAMENQENAMDENHAVAELRVSKETTNGTTSDPEPSRVCKMCNEEKPETEYYRTSLGYLEGTCKRCRIKMKQDRENAKKKKEHVGAMKKSEKRSEGGPLPPSALARQVGGDHYKTFVIQPIEFSTRNGLGFIQGDIVKRICRYNRPGGKGHEDLRKIMHECELLIEMAGIKGSSLTF